MLEKIVHVLDVINFVHPLWNSCNVYKVLCPEKDMNKNNKPQKSLRIKFYNKQCVQLSIQTVIPNMGDWRRCCDVIQLK